MTSPTFSSDDRPELDRSAAPPLLPQEVLPLPSEVHELEGLVEESLQPQTEEQDEAAKAVIPQAELQQLLDTIAELRVQNEELTKAVGAVSNDGPSTEAATPVLDADATASAVSANKDALDQHLAEAIFQHSHDAILVLDFDRCVSANTIACQLFDCTLEELYSQNFYRLLASKFNIQNADWADSLHHQLANEGCVMCELRRDTPEGELWVELTLRRFETESESKVLLVGHDISRLRKFQAELSRSHDFLHHTINSVRQPLSVKSANLRYVLANQAFCELLNLPFERIKGRTFSELIGADATQAKQLDEATLESGEASINTEWLWQPDGTIKTLSSYRSRFHDPGTGAAFVVTAARDVTAELSTQRRLRLLASVFENAHESVAILTKEGAVFEANPEFMGTVGWQRDDLNGKSLARFVDWGEANFAEVMQLATGGTPWFGHVKLAKGSEQAVSCWLSLSPSKNQNGEITNLIAMFSDITQIESTRSELHRQALHDNLTRLPNRRYFRQRITELIEADRDGRTRFGVLFLDLDDFKIVNDSLGHDAGDRLLVEVSRRIRECLGDDCFMARFGGDEFALLIPEADNSQTLARKYSEAVVDVLCAPFLLSGNEVRVGVSVGTTVYPDDARDVESLMRQADVAMYKAKEEGKNKVHWFSPELVEVIERRQAMLAALRNAIDQQQLSVVYQPKLDLQTNRVVGCESLLRWQREDGTFVPPNEFIPLAEESGLINRLGDQLFHAVCRQAASWHSVGQLRGPIAVNLTQRQMKEPRLIERLVRAIKEHGIQPEWLELEITENAIMSDVDGAVALMNRIREQKIRIAIDDFGTGYSSLGYVKNFPVQSLKLDNLFVDGLPSDSASVAVAQTVMSLAHGLDLTVCAEGVETAEQQSFLKSIGCDAVQGYLLAPPMDANAFEAWLSKR